MRRGHSTLISLAALLGAAGALTAQDLTAERLVVTGDRTDLAPDESGSPQIELDRALLDQSPALRLDDALREQVPGFSLFRRNSSRVANPTTQGVSLRNIGPNGAGRTLVLLDGVPQNDPFGGWVYWSVLPTASIDRVRIVEGGGAGLFGSAALGGTIELRSRQAAGDAWMAQVEGGDAGTYEVDLAGQKSVGAGWLTLFGRADRFSSDGYPVVRGDRRGPVDIDASATDEILDGGVRMLVGDSDVLTVRARAFHEERGNGTPLTDNTTDAVDLSATWAGEWPGTEVDYQILAYGQLRDFSSTFSSVNAARTLETPSLDQYDVPARSAGGSLTVNLPLPGKQNLLVGADARWIDGESDERFRFLGGAFTRNREAGGAQVFAGGFLEDTWRPATGTTLGVSGRLDYYANTGGWRRESDLGTGATLLDEHFATRDGVEPNGRVSASQQIWGDLLRARAAAYTGFRVPTLNELYRPFRVGNDITEANAGLRPERLYGLEGGLESRPVKSLLLSAGSYYNEVQRAVANVTVARGPVTVDPFGFIPAGGTGELRENLGRVAVYGVEAGAEWTPDPSLRFSASYLYSHGTVERAPAQRGLEGKRLAQSPEQQGVIGVHWATPWKPLQATLQTRLVGDQFEDDENTLSLASYATVDVMVSLQISAHLQGWIAVENLFDTEVETGASANGVVSIGAPRLLDAGMRWAY